MSDHNPHSRRPLTDRLIERATGIAFRSVTRLVGLRPEFVPSHLRRQLTVIGVDDQGLAKVLRNINRLGDWPYAWEAEGDRCVAAGDFDGALAAYYVGQRVLIQDTPLKRRLYGLSVEAYLSAETTYPIEVLRLRYADRGVAGYLQLPPGASAEHPVPLILVLPGVGSTKEEFHPFVNPFVAAGYAVARIDMPGFGQTEGLVDDTTTGLPGAVLDTLSQDPRIDSSRRHLFGVSLGAYWALHAAVATQVNSVVTVSAPFQPHLFFDRLPPMQIEALLRMTGNTTHKQLYASMRAMNLAPHASRITAPVRIYHGTADQTVPVEEAYDLSRALSGLRTMTIYEDVHHNCLERFDELVSGSLAWFEDPDAVTSRHVATDSTRFSHAKSVARTLAMLPATQS